METKRQGRQTDQERNTERHRDEFDKVETYFDPLGVFESKALSIAQRSAELDHQPEQHAVLDRLSEHLLVLVEVEHLAIVEPLL